MISAYYAGKVSREATMSSTGQQRGRARDSAPAGRAQPSDTRPGAPKSPGQATMPPRKTWLWFVVVIVANFLLVRLLLPGPEGPITVPYTLFKEEVRKGNVQAIHSQGDTITGRFKAPVTHPPASEKTAPPKSESPTASERRAAPREQQTAEIIDAEVLRIINESNEEARRLLGTHRKQLDALAKALVPRETLNEQEILEVTGLPPAPPLPSGVTAAPREGAAP